MKFLVLDFETYYHPRDYSVKKLGTEAYIRDSRFEAHGAAVKWMGGGPAVWLDDPDLRAFLATVDWNDTALVCHHFQFDGLILSKYYNVHPRLCCCTLSMARLMIGNHVSSSLDSVRSYFNIPPKITPYNLFAGLHWSEMSPYIRAKVAEGAADEVESIAQIFKALMVRGFPLTELEVVDVTMRMFTEPVLVGDIELLAGVWEAEALRKQTVMAELGITADELQSAEKFATLLRERGIEPEMKEGKNGEIYAFSKTDDFMRELQESEDEHVAALADARLGAKSTLVQSRAERIGYMASRGALAIYLAYAAAHTTRWGGGDGTNFQNLPSRNKSALGLRRAIKPPEGFVVVKPDKSQIECRVLNTLAGQWDKVEEFRKGEDPYIGVASAFYGRPITKENDPLERQCGKVLELQCGYGSGGEKIRFTLKNQETPILITEDQGEAARDAYRSTHPAVVELWKAGNRMLGVIANGQPMDWGPLHLRDGRVYLPNGAPMIYQLDFYHDLESGDEYWRRKTRRGFVKIYGAKLIENVVQALSRVIISDDMIVLNRMGYRITNTEHDSLWILLADDSQLARHKRVIEEVMTRTPPWMPALPVGVEIN